MVNGTARENEPNIHHRPDHITHTASTRPNRRRVCNSGVTMSVLTSAPYTGTVEQIRQPLYTQLADGGIRNTYEVKLNNKLTAPMTVGIRIEGLPGATLDMDGMERLELTPQERIKLLARVQIPPVVGGKAAGDKVTFIIEALAGATAEPIRREVPFYIPASN